MRSSRDEIALHLALKINDETVIGAYPSLYLNIAKGYESLNDLDSAKKNYELALSSTLHLSDDGYVNLIKGGIIPQERFFQVLEQGLLAHSSMTKEILRVKVYGDIALVTGRGKNTAIWQGQKIEADE